jgi:hypothetical protein
MPNYDPNLVFDHTTQFRRVPLEQDGQPIGDILLPEADIAGLSEDGIRDAALQTWHIFDTASQMVPVEWVQDAARDMDLAPWITRFTAGLIVANVGAIYTARAGEDPTEQAAVPGDRLTEEAWRQAEDRTSPFVARAFAEELAPDRIWGSVHQHVLGWALMALEQQHGRATLAALPDAEFAQRLQTYITETMDLTGAVGETIALYSQALARAYLDALDPEHLSLEDLRRVLGFDVSTTAHSVDLTDVGARAAQGLPTMFPQWTFQEARTLTIAIADGPALRRWAEIAGEVALRHVIPDEPLQTKFMPSPRLTNWWGLPATYDGLRNELQAMRLPAILLLHVGLGLALEAPQVTVSIDDLIAAIGWKPRSTAERSTLRQTIWRWLLVFDSLEVIGKRPGVYRDRQTKQTIDLQSVDALIRITGRRVPAQPALDGSAAPLEITFVAGPWLDQWRGNHQVLAHFGEVRRLAGLPAGQPRGAWAQSIGLALHQRWRERAQGAEMVPVGEQRRLTARFDKPFTRRDLLGLFRAQPDFDDILQSANPDRARKYWDAALRLLRQVQVVGYCEPLAPLVTGRKEWQDPWLDQPLDIRPRGDATAAVATIARKAATAKRVRAAQRRTPSKSSRRS